MKIVDLHTHSNISDGSCTPAELIRLAKASDLGGIALTDHDTIAGVAEARAEAARLDFDFLAGMEMSVAYQDRQLHIVALGFDEGNAKFQELYQKIRNFKEAGIERLVERIAALGADISPAKIQPFVKAGVVDRYAIMRYFVSLRLFDDVQKIWDVYINPGMQGGGENVTAAEAIAAVKAAGGVTSLAHFHKRLGFNGLTRAQQDAALGALMDLGLDGMEAQYPNYSADDRSFAAAMIEKYHMLPTGGTDFHGENRPAVELGTGIGNNIAVPYRIYENVARRLRSAGEKKIYGGVFI